MTIYGKCNLPVSVDIDRQGPGNARYALDNTTDVLFTNTNLTQGFHSVYFVASNSSGNYTDTQLAFYLDRVVIGAQVGAEG